MAKQSAYEQRNQDAVKKTQEAVEAFKEAGKGDLATVLECMLDLTKASIETTKQQGAATRRSFSEKAKALTGGSRKSQPILAPEGQKAWEYHFGQIRSVLKDKFKIRQTSFEWMYKAYLVMENEIGLPELKEVEGKGTIDIEAYKKVWDKIVTDIGPSGMNLDALPWMHFGICRIMTPMVRTHAEQACANKNIFEVGAQALPHSAS